MNPLTLPDIDAILGHADFWDRAGSAVTVIGPAVRPRIVGSSSGWAWKLVGPAGDLHASPGAFLTIQRAKDDLHRFLDGRRSALAEGGAPPTAAGERPKPGVE